MSPGEGFVGGSEEAVICLSDALQRVGWSVTVYAPLPESRPEGSMYGGVTWKPSREFNPADDHQNVMFWRAPTVSREPWFEAAKFRKFLWLHDSAYSTWGAKPADFRRFDRVIALSNAHVEQLFRNEGAIADVIGQNGIDPFGFPEPDESRRVPHRVIYASAPERGLAPLLWIWPEVMAAVPDAKLHIYYDWTVFRLRYPVEAAWLTGLLESREGVVFHGGVRPEELHDAFRQASVWGYPLNGADSETFCLNLIKAEASGCIPVCSDAASLPEFLMPGIEPVHFDFTGLPEVDDQTQASIPEEFLTAFTARLITTLQTPAAEHQATRKQLRTWVLDRFTWDHAARRFIEIFEGVVEA